jgi:hypothetical protein
VNAPNDSRIATYDLLETFHWSEVFEIFWVGDLTRFPRTLVGRILYHRRIPFALVSGVGLLWSNGHSLARCESKMHHNTYRFHSPQPGASLQAGLSMKGPIHSPSSSSSHSSGLEASTGKIERRQLRDRMTPTRVWNSQGFVIEPTFGFDRFLIEDLVWLVLVPVIRLVAQAQGSM